MEHTSRKICTLLLPPLSAVLCSLSLAHPRLAPLCLVALVPLLGALDAPGPAREHRLRGLLFGLVLACGEGWWLVPTLSGPYGRPPLFAVLFFVCCAALPCALLALLFAAFYRLLRRDTLAFSVLTVPALWVLGEYLKELLPGAVPWGSLAVAAVPLRHLVQVADLGGGYGLLFVVVLVNAVGWRLLRTLMIRGPRRTLVSALLVLILVLGLSRGYGAWRLAAMAEGGETLPVLLVQGNFSNEARWGEQDFAPRIATYLRMSEQAPAALVVWPETVLNVPARLTPDFLAALAGSLVPGTVLVAGAVHDDEAGRTCNSACLLAGDGRGAWYDKHILLPYAETSTAFLGRYAGAPESFDPGTGGAVIRTPRGTLGVSICLEMLYPGHIRRSVRDGATLLVNLSNDSWFGDTAMPRVHLAVSRLRAVENRRWVLRAATSGISAIIAPDGSVQQQSPLFTRTTVAGTARLTRTPSPYTRLGNWILPLCLLIVLGGGWRGGKRFLGEPFL